MTTTTTWQWGATYNKMGEPLQAPLQTTPYSHQHMFKNRTLLHYTQEHIPPISICSKTEHYYTTHKNNNNQDQGTKLTNWHLITAKNNHKDSNKHMEHASIKKFYTTKTRGHCTHIGNDLYMHDYLDARRATFMKDDTTSTTTTTTMTTLG